MEGGVSIAFFIVISVIVVVVVLFFPWLLSKENIGGHGRIRKFWVRQAAFRKAIPRSDGSPRRHLRRS